MHRSITAAGIALLFATTVWAANPSPMNSATPSTPVDRRTLSPMSTEPEAATLQVSGPAPMFSYIATDGRWHRSDELLSRGPVLVVFAPAEDDLVAIQRLAHAFDDLGVRPVAVLDLPTRGTAALTRRLQLTTALVSDPMSAIAGLYHSLDPTTGQHAPAYFVIDSRRTLRAMYYGPLPPAELLVACAARSLGRPLPPSLFTTFDEP
jgi:peroxiredoxin